MCVVNARCWCNRQILWAARRSVQVTEDKPLAILVKGIAEVLHIVFTELDSRKTQAIRKRHSAARLRPSADRNRSSTRISRLPGVGHTDPTAAPWLCFVSGWVLQLGDRASGAVAKPTLIRNRAMAQQLGQ